MPELIENPFYNALLTENASFAVTNSLAARYKPDIIPMGGVAEKSPDAMCAFRNLLALGEELWTTGDCFPDVDGLLQVSTLPCLQMHYTGSTRTFAQDATIVRLKPENAAEMMALKAVAFPGYFFDRAHVLGDFFGIRDEATGELIAMGGERLSVPGYREISALCTHPEHTGKGLAAKLMQRVMSAQADRGAKSFLHVIVANERAVRLYERLGFETSGTVNFQRFRRLF